jgi:Uma2 family endonuclease
MAIIQIEVDDPPELPTGMIETDGVPMESEWHRLAMSLLIETVSYRLHDRQDYFVGGNMFLYFNQEQVRTRDYRGPDFFFVWGRPVNPPRPYYAVWLEDGKYPDVIIELSSQSTAGEDLTIKKDIYEPTFRTHEYFVYDPAERKLSGWRLVSGNYDSIQPNDRGWLWCDELQLWLGPWHGEFQGKIATYLRFFDEAGQLVVTRGEGESQLRILETQRADTEHHAKEAALQKLRAAETELAKLKAQLAQGGKTGNP